MKTNELCHVTNTAFHDRLDSESRPFKAKRYWLFTSKLCPFAHRTEIARKLLKLTDIIGLTIAGSIQTSKGWNLADRYQSPDSAPCPIDGVTHVPEIYQRSTLGYSGRASVPILFDTTSNIIINNESAEIVRQLDELAVRLLGYRSLYPSPYRDLIDQHLQQLDNKFIAPIYRAGFSQDQDTYHANFEQVFGYLKTLDQQLKSVPYLAGEQITIVDIHAYCHLSRFDSVYHALYHLNLNYLSSYPNISAYMLRLANIADFADTLDVQTMKAGYFHSWNQPTPGYFVPEGPIVDPRSGLAITPQ